VCFATPSSASIARFHEADFSMRILVVGATGAIARSYVQSVTGAGTGSILEQAK
jgi:hypothetical protein